MLPSQGRPATRSGRQPGSDPWSPFPCEIASSEAPRRCSVGDRIKEGTPTAPSRGSPSARPSPGGDGGSGADRCADPDVTPGVRSHVQGEMLHQGGDAAAQDVVLVRTDYRLLLAVL